jgi:peptidoglycan/xylan/chitin deacetylase (PgdA/CDA1 family)
MKFLSDSIIAIRKTVYIALGAFDRVILNSKNTVFIISYHSISEDSWRFSIDEKEIKKQITWLKKHFAIISLKTLDAYLQGNAKITKPSVVLTFDDGYKDVLRLRPFFDKLSITPALFVLSDTTHANILEMKTKRPFLTSAEIKQCKKAGWVIGSHSGTHANLSKLSQKELEKEIIESKKTLEKKLGFSIDYFCYPRGKYNQKVVSLVKKAKYHLGLTMDDGIINAHCNAFLLPRVGIDRTHSFLEFTNTFSPSVIKFRKLIKVSMVGKYL